MKRTISLWLGLMAFALLPALAQTPAALKGPTGKIHGHITGPEGTPRTVGTVSLSTDNGHTSKFTFPVTSTGEYTGEATPGTYTVVYRMPDTPPDKMVDSIDNVKIVAGQDVLQDVDMSRKEFIDKNLTADQKKQLEELKKKNAEAMKSNAVINAINVDLKQASQDLKDIDGADATARQALGANPSKSDVDAKVSEIKNAKYTEIQTLMLKDTVLKPDASVLWAQLGQSQVGLARAQNDQKLYDEAEASMKKVLELEAASKKPNISTQGVAYSGLGEIYARNNKVPEANEAYDQAAKINPTSAGVYLKNEAVIFSNVGNGDASAAAADEAIKIDPTQPILYYLKGQGLIAKATIDSKTGKMVLPPGCAEAYQQYLVLAPTGAYAGDVKAILAEATQTHNTSVGVEKPKKGR
ncbi:MAG: tetratricopeptide repeat protein [Terracidiphilus sp.]|jgi:tetratricopeptide (TPR) repeat protein